MASPNYDFDRFAPREERAERIPRQDPRAATARDLSSAAQPAPAKAPPAQKRKPRPVAPQPTKSFEQRKAEEHASWVSARHLFSVFAVALVGLLAVVYVYAGRFLASADLDRSQRDLREVKELNANYKNAYQQKFSLAMIQNQAERVLLMVPAEGSQVIYIDPYEGLLPKK
ncbi:MAG: hypothetical protein LBJ11_08150 [Oscillospiraceae bacterium]|jgi:hypothetical protein|nr:hypothetical protein [Oscillospiraceae bacterium]